MNKLSRKDIAMLEVLAVTEESKGKLAEYVQQREKAAEAYKAFREAVVNGVEVEKVVKPAKPKRKFKTGDKVRVLVEDGADASTDLKVGEITTVVGYKEDDDYWSTLFGARVQERPVVTEKCEGDGKDYFSESALELVEEKSPNELRAEIIQRAKEFVEGNSLRKEDATSGKYLSIAGRKTYIEFVVNVEKLTVVALAKGVGTDIVRAKGIAKCNPSDVYNEHIGKAIALGRALGKDVSEFENAVQPTEPVIGHKLSNVYCDDIDEITATKGVCMFINNTGGFWNKGTLDSGTTKIIDDTNAQYEEVLSDGYQTMRKV